MWFTWKKHDEVIYTHSLYYFVHSVYTNQGRLHNRNISQYNAELFCSTTQSTSKMSTKLIRLNETERYKMISGMYDTALLRQDVVN